MSWQSNHILYSLTLSFRVPFSSWTVNPGPRHENGYSGAVLKIFSIYDEKEVYDSTITPFARTILVNKGIKNKSPPESGDGERDAGKAF